MLEVKEGIGLRQPQGNEASRDYDHKPTNKPLFPPLAKRTTKKNGKERKRATKEPQRTPSEPLATNLQLEHRPVCIHPRRQARSRIS
jgi:hypothetical protein